MNGPGLKMSNEQRSPMAVKYHEKTGFEGDKDIEIMKECLKSRGFDIKDYLERKDDKILLEGQGIGRGPEEVHAEYVYRKAYEIEQTLKFRHGMLIMSLGHRLVHGVAKANGWHVVETNSEYATGKQPLTCEQLFGTVEKQSGTFVDLLKDSVSGELSKKEGLKLIIIPDMHDISPEIAEKMHTLLDDNKYFETAWGERIHLPADVRVVIDSFVQGKSHPAHFSRMGVVYFTDE